LLAPGAKKWDELKIRKLNVMWVMKQRR